MKCFALASIQNKVGRCLARYSPLHFVWSLLLVAINIIVTTVITLATMEIGEDALRSPNDLANLLHCSSGDLRWWFQNLNRYKYIIGIDTDEKLTRNLEFTVPSEDTSVHLSHVNILKVSNFTLGYTLIQQKHTSYLSRTFKFLHMTDVEKYVISFVVCTIYGILLHFTLFCCQICFFWRFTLFCRIIGFSDLRTIMWRKI